jgi:hypothetical protein
MVCPGRCQKKHGSHIISEQQVVMMVMVVVMMVVVLLLLLHICEKSLCETAFHLSTND